MIEVQTVDEEREVLLVAGGRVQVVGEGIRVEPSLSFQVMVMQRECLVGSVTILWSQVSNHHLSSGQDSLRARFPLSADLTQDLFQEEGEDKGTGSVQLLIKLSDEFMGECVAQQQEQTARIAQEQQQLQNEQSASLRRDNLTNLLNQPMSTPQRHSPTHPYLLSSIAHDPLVSRGHHMTNSILDHTNNPPHLVHSFSCNDNTNNLTNNLTINNLTNNLTNNNLTNNLTNNNLTNNNLTNNLTQTFPLLVEPTIAPSMPAERPSSLSLQEHDTMLKMLLLIHRQLEGQKVRSLDNEECLRRLGRETEEEEGEDTKEKEYLREVKGLEKRVVLRESQAEELRREKEALEEQECGLKRQASCMQSELEESQSKNKHLQATHAWLAKQALSTCAITQQPNNLPPILSFQPIRDTKQHEAQSETELKQEKHIYNQRVEALREAQLEYLSLAQQVGQEELSRSGQNILRGLDRDVTQPIHQRLVSLQDSLLTQHSLHTQNTLLTSSLYHSQLLDTQKVGQESQERLLAQKKDFLTQGQKKHSASQQKNLEKYQEEEERQQQVIGDLQGQLGDQSGVSQQYSVPDFSSSQTLFQQQTQEKKAVYRQLYHLDRTLTTNYKESQRLDSQIRFLSASIEKQETFIKQMIGTEEEREETRYIEAQLSLFYKEHGYEFILRKGSGPEENVYYIGQKRIEVRAGEGVQVKKGGGWMSLEEYLRVFHQQKH